MDGTPKLTLMPVSATRALHPVIEESLTEPKMYRVSQLRFSDLLKTVKKPVISLFRLDTLVDSVFMTQIQLCQNVEECK